MSIYRMFSWTVKAGLEEEHEAAFQWHLRHWIEKHPRVLSTRYFRPEPSLGPQSNQRMCIVECASMDDYRLVKTVENNPECAQVLAALVATIEGGKWEPEWWQDADRSLWKEPKA